MWAIAGPRHVVVGTRQACPRTNKGFRLLWPRTGVCTHRRRLVQPERSSSGAGIATTPPRGGLVCAILHHARAATAVGRGPCPRADALQSVRGARLPALRNWYRRSNCANRGQPWVGRASQRRGRGGGSPRRRGQGVPLLPGGCVGQRRRGCLREAFRDGAGREETEVSRISSVVPWRALLASFFSEQRTPFQDPAQLLALALTDVNTSRTRGLSASPCCPSSRCQQTPPAFDCLRCCPLLTHLALFLGMLLHFPPSLLCLSLLRGLL